MALLGTAGTNNVDLAVAGTYRQDQSELLMSALYLDPSLMGTLQGGESFSGNAAYKIWNEEALNPNQVTDTVGGGLNNSQTTMTVSSSDAAVLDTNTILADATISGGIEASERLQITGITTTGGTSTLTVVRGALGGPVATSHSASTKWQILSSAIPANSDLGADRTKPRVQHGNYVQREDFNVNLGNEVLDSSANGYTPGVPNEMDKQLRNRMLEKMIILNRAIEYGIGTPGNGTVGSVAGNNSTFWGLIPMLSGSTFGVNGAFNSTASVTNFAASYTAGQIDLVVNDANETLMNNGVRPDYLYCPSPMARSIARLYKDQIRLVQDETTRGFFVKAIQTDLGNEIRIIVDQYLSRTNGSIDALMVDSGRIRICPYDNEYMSYITAPSFRDGKAARCVIKITLEVRNTGSDTGQSHYWIQNITV